MPELLNPFSGMVPARKLTLEELARAIRLDLKWGHVNEALYYHRRQPRMRSEAHASEQNQAHARLLRAFR